MNNTITTLIPYEKDELLYSWLHRIGQASLIEDLEGFLSAYFAPEKIEESGKYSTILEPKQSLRAFLTNAQIDRHLWLQILMDTSMLPYVLPFLTEDALFYLLVSATWDLPYRDRKTLERILPAVFQNKLRFCPECMKEDKEKYGTYLAYRIHQVPGMRVCPKHHTALYEFTGFPFYEFRSEQAIKPITVPFDMETAIRYADFCCHLSEEQNGKRIHNIIPEIVRLAQIHRTVSDRIFQKVETYQTGTYADYPDAFTLAFDVLENSDLSALFTDVNIIQETDGSLTTEYARQNHFDSTFVHQLCEEHANISGMHSESVRLPYATTHSREFFERLVKNMTGDDYHVCGSYTDYNTPVQMRHETCGTIFKAKPSAFAGGARCPYCTERISSTSLKTILHNIGSRYAVINDTWPINGSYVIMDTETNISFSLSRSMIIQELVRKDGSAILPTDAMTRGSADMQMRIFVEHGTDNEYLFEYLLKHYRKDEMIFGEDLIPVLANYNFVIRQLVRTHKLYQVIWGVYCLSDKQFTGEEIAYAKYIGRRGRVFGYFCGDTLRYKLGYRKKPKAVHIATSIKPYDSGVNHRKEKLGYNVRIYNGTHVNLKQIDKPEISNANAEILALIDLMIATNKTGTIAERQCFEIAKAYMLRFKITPQQCKSYTHYFPFYERILNKIFDIVELGIEGVYSGYDILLDKAVDSKKYMLKEAIEFGGVKQDAQVCKELDITPNSYYKYKTQVINALTINAIESVIGKAFRNMTDKEVFSCILQCVENGTVDLTAFANTVLMHQPFRERFLRIVKNVEPENVCRREGNEKLHAVESKRIIFDDSPLFGGTMQVKDVMKKAGINLSSYGRYKREITISVMREYCHPTEEKEQENILKEKNNLLEVAKSCSSLEDVNVFFDNKKAWKEAFRIIKQSVDMKSPDTINWLTDHSYYMCYHPSEEHYNISEEEIAKRKLYVYMNGTQFCGNMTIKQMTDSSIVTRWEYYLIRQELIFDLLKLFEKC